MVGPECLLRLSNILIGSEGSPNAGLGLGRIGHAAMTYSAFISYSSKDVSWARWLHLRLERFKLPKRIAGDLPIRRAGRRLKPVFRDRDELSASADLGQQINTALAESYFLIVICSPSSAGSRWVNAEVAEFKRLGRQGRILCLIVDGEPGTDDPALRCFPPSLTSDNGIEPLAADVRSDRDGKNAALLKLLATMLDVRFDDLRQRDQSRKLRQLTMITTGSLLGLAIAVTLALFAYFARNEAIEQRDIARTRTLTAERTVEFVKGMFSVADPSEARGATITAREIVDRAASDFRASLKDEPEVRSEIGLTLGEVYGALGLYRQSDALIRSMAGIRVSNGTIAARQSILLGESQFRLGNYDTAIRDFRRALALMDTSEERNEALLSQAQVGLGQSYSAIDKFELADKALRQALTIDTNRGPAGMRHRARDLEALGNNALFSGELKVARSFFEQANAIVLRLDGDNSPSVSDNYDRLATIAYLVGNSRQAEKLFRARIKIDEKVLGPEHPDVALTLNNLGRILLERRAFAEALPLLERSASISLKEKGAMHDDMAFILNNLGLAQLQAGQVTAAEATLRQAVTVATVRRSRMAGPASTDLIGLLCRTGRTGEARALLSDARKAVSAEYPDDPWRQALIDNVWAECLWRSGDNAEAARLVRSSTPVILERWKPKTMFGFDAQARRLMMAEITTVQ